MATVALLAAAVADGNAAAVAGILAAGRLPWLLFSTTVGRLVDSRSPFAVVKVALAVRVTSVVLLATLTWQGLITVPTLAALSFLLGATEVAVDISNDAALPQLVDESQYWRAGKTLRTTQTITDDMAGKSLGGFLAGVSHAVGLGVAGLLSAIALVTFPQVPPRRDNEPTVENDRRSSFTLVWRNPPLRRLLGTTVVTSLFFSSLIGVQVLFVTITLEASSFQYGLLLAVSSLGGVAAAVIPRSAIPGKSPARKLASMVWALAATYIGVWACASIGGWAAYVTVACLDVASALFVVLYAVEFGALRLRLTPSDAQGRVASVFRLCSFGVATVGTLLGGVCCAFAARFVDPSAVYAAQYGVVALALFAVGVAWTRSSYDASETSVGETV